jgi:hypothetical protein
VKDKTIELLPSMLSKSSTYSPGLIETSHPVKLIAGGFAETVVGNGGLDKITPVQDKLPYPKDEGIGDGTATV